MKKITILLVLAFCSLSVEAVKVNPQGKKLVQQIKEEWIDWTGDRVYNFCHTNNFTYDVEGNLQSVSKSSEDKPHKFIEKLEFVDNDFKFILLQDGKPVQSHKRQYYWNKSYKHPGIDIKGCLISDHAVEDGFDNYFAKVHYYTDTYTLRMDCIGYDTFDEWIGYLKNDQNNVLWTAPDMNPLNHLYLIPNEVFMKFGFKNGMHRYMSSDSIMYLVDGYEMKEFAYMNGNPVDRPQGELSQYREPSNYRIEYTSYDNDTNVNILFLSNSETLNSFYTNVECITEWFPIQSKKLPSYYRRIGNSHDKKWDYKFDNESNLVEIIMEDRGAGGKNTVIYTISYVLE